MFLRNIGNDGLISRKAFIVMRLSEVKPLEYCPDSTYTALHCLCFPANDHLRVITKGSGGVWVLYCDFRDVHIFRKASKFPGSSSSTLIKRKESLESLWNAQHITNSCITNMHYEGILKELKL
jgi:hypothetical protein